MDISAEHSTDSEQQVLHVWQVWLRQQTSNLTHLTIFFFFWSTFLKVIGESLDSSPGIDVKEEDEETEGGKRCAAVSMLFTEICLYIYLSVHTEGLIPQNI